MNTLFLAYLGPWQLILLLLFLGSFILLPLLALINIIKNEFTGNNKLIWALVVIFFPFFGSILYFAIGRSQQIKDAQQL